MPPLYKITISEGVVHFYFSKATITIVGKPPKFLKGVHGGHISVTTEVVGFTKIPLPSIFIKGEDSEHGYIAAIRYLETPDNFFFGWGATIGLAKALTDNFWKDAEDSFVDKIYEQLK